jgi:hypothetical protein
MKFIQPNYFALDIVGPTASTETTSHEERDRDI